MKPTIKLLLALLVAFSMSVLAISCVNSYAYYESFVEKHELQKQRKKAFKELVKQSKLPEWVVRLGIDEADKQNVDPILVLSIIRVESWGNPKAVSKSGAIGLMQVMPFHKPKNPRILFKPRVNVNYGVMYLKTACLSKFPNDLEKGISAYNTGPNATKWVPFWRTKYVTKWKKLKSTGKWVKYKKKMRVRVWKKMHRINHNYVNKVVKNYLRMTTFSGVHKALTFVSSRRHISKWLKYKKRILSLRSYVKKVMVCKVSDDSLTETLCERV